MKTALLVIDAQNIYTIKGASLYCENAKTTVKNINKLIKIFDANKLPIFMIRHIHKQNGSDLGRMFDYSGEPVEDFNFKSNSEEIEFDMNLFVPENSIKIVKNRYSSFVGTMLNEKLKELKIEKVVICGFMTNFCCESTARDAHDLDYFVDFVIDSTGTPGTEKMTQSQIIKIVSQLLSEGFAVVKSTKELLKELNK